MLSAIYIDSLVYLEGLTEYLEFSNQLTFLNKEMNESSRLIDVQLSRHRPLSILVYMHQRKFHKSIASKQI